MKKGKKEVTKVEVIKNLLEVNENYQKDHYGLITRNYYQEHGQYTQSQYYPIFGTWKQLLKDSGLMDDEHSELFKLEKKLLVLKSENSELKKSNEKLIQNEINHENYLELYKEHLTTTTPPKLDNKIIPKKNNLKAVLVLSDWHCGETVKPETVNYINHYNTDVMVRRLDDIFNQFITHCKNFGIVEADLIFNGDLLHGRIHPENERNQEQDVVQSMLIVQNYITTKVQFLTKYLNKINLTFIIGNHARIIEGRPYFADQVSMNFEYLMGKQVEIYMSVFQQQLKTKKISVCVSESTFTVLNVNGHKLLATHGDLLTGAGGGGFAGIPLYSLAMSSAKMYGVLSQAGISDDNDNFDSIVIGHLHTDNRFKLFTGGNLYLNGCIVGTDHFSLQKMKSVASISQTMLMISEQGEIFLDFVLKSK